MPGSLEFETFINVVIFFQNWDDIRRHRGRYGSAGVTYDVHAMLCSREKNVDTIRSLQETTVVLVVASNKKDDNDSSLLSLEVINSSNLQCLKEYCVGGPRHVLLRVDTCFL